jgi:hypothetical protein
MEENEETAEEKHPTKATTSEPQEEFIEPKPRPSEDESEAKQLRREHGGR